MAWPITPLVSQPSCSPRCWLPWSKKIADLWLISGLYEDYRYAFHDVPLRFPRVPRAPYFPASATHDQRATADSVRYSDLTNTRRSHGVSGSGWQSRFERVV